MSSCRNNRKDKGKGIRRAEDYQLEVPMQLPTRNQFQTLAKFPPLLYKSIVAKPPTKPTVDNPYVVRHIEHLFLTNYKTMPSPDLVQKAFGKKHFATYHSQKT